MDNTAYTLITGATSDIGKQICKTLDASGHLLLLTDWNEDDLNKTLLELTPSKTHRILPLDLSNVTHAKQELQAYIEENKISVSNVVFAAGIFSIKPVKMLDYDFVKRNFDVAIFSAMMITQVLSAKKTNGVNLSSVVFMSSISAKMGTKGYATYAAVKAAMLGLVKSLAAELSPRVRVNAILPGGIRTKTTAFLFETMGTNPRYLLGEGDKTDISYMVDFLLSDKSKWITGQEFIVDGGMMCN